MSTHWLAFLCICMVAGACSHKTGPIDTGVDAPVQSVFDPDTGAALQQVIDNAAQGYKLVGAAALIQSPGGDRWQGTYGTSALPEGTPIDIGNHGKIGSITKTFTATVILKLVEQRLLALDDTLADHAALLASAGFDLPADAADPSKDWRPITIRQLLYHTSGIPNYLAQASEQFLAAPLRVWTPTELLGFVRDRQLQFPSGSAWNYSNTGYIVLAMIAEGVSGTPIEQLIATQVLAQADPPLANTVFPADATLAKPFNRGYFDGFVDMNGDGVINNLDKDRMIAPEEDSLALDASASWASGAMYTTLEDLLRWSRIVAKGDLLSAELQAERTTFIDTGIPGLPLFGLGVANDNGMIGHVGDIYGYNAMMGYKDGWQFAIMVTGNSNVAPVDAGMLGPANDILAGFRDVLEVDRSSAAPAASPSAASAGSP